MSLSWVNKEFLVKALRASHDNDKIEFQVKNFKIKRAVEDNNCSSIVHNVIVWYKIDSSEEISHKSFIIKSYTQLISIDIMEKEKITYAEALPKIESMLRFRFAPKFLLSRDYTLVMENIKELGFRNVNSYSLLDFDHCVVALEALAKFHAGSVLLHQQEPDLVEKEIGWDTCVNNSEIDVIAFLKKMFRIFIKEISTWPEAKHHAGDFRLVVESVDEYFKNVTVRDGLKVLNHGDFWVNNQLFRYDRLGNLLDIRLVDFQGCRYCSPACDVQYFIASSASLDVRLNRQDEILHVYLNKLNETLSQLELPDRITMDEFDECMQEEYIMYFVGLCMSLCTCLNDPKDRFTCEGFETFEEIENDASIRFEHLLRSPRYRNFVPPVLESLEQNGAFLSFRQKGRTSKEC